LAVRPNWLSFIHLMASASSLTFMTGMTGPKVSSHRSHVVSVGRRGLEGRVLGSHILSALGDSILDVSPNGFGGAFGDNRPNMRRFVERITQLVVGQNFLDLLDKVITAPSTISSAAHARSTSGLIRLFRLQPSVQQDHQQRIR
ncbi:hypothetical protein KCU62_g240, partial [Aureobasidium sp. EXF-3399]